ncbi:MAG: arginine--tRNA ligase [Candidatus Parvarchaeum sp.]|nr:arginine--tRNA ligase [Candidatus Parvarchaeota archaeon]MCW1295049.1 arginine--tRNA ligase [Candidatus Parvarchaeum tengchongense]MCW1299069.1 arginine--tRNA ligase [Candidatus Parvarchaeum tengchongense]
MKFQEIREKLNLPDWADITTSQFSDISFSCIGYAKSKGKDPVLFAEETAKKIGSKYVRKAVALNGYVNIDLKFDELEKSEKILSKIEIKSVKNSFSGKTVRLEHTSVNPNKALHIGHMRNSYIGEFMRKALIYSSANVITSNFIEDTGAQVADIIVGFKYLNKKMETTEKFDLYCSKIYKEVNEDYEKDKSLLEKRKEVLLKIEAGDKDTLEFLDSIVNKVLLAQLSTLIGERIKYNLLDLERYILGEGIVKAALDKLMAEGIAKVSESEKNKGCIVSNVDGSEITLTRSDGTSLYIAKDIAYAMIKHSILEEKIKYRKFSSNFDGTDIMISSRDGNEANLQKIDISFTLTDSAQNAEQNAVKSIIERFAGKDSYNHYGYEPVSISKDTAAYLGIATDEKFMRMSGRKGITVEFDDLAVKIKNRVIEEAEKSGRKMDEESAKKIASNVIRYYILRFSPSKMVVFDINDAISLKGDSAVYINYSYSRALSILNKASKNDYNNISFDENEAKFIREIFLWETVLDNAVSNLKPNLVCEYLHKISDVFNAFYEKNRILGDTREKERLLLVIAFKTVVESLSYFIGIDLVKRI